MKGNVIFSEFLLLEGSAFKSTVNQGDFEHFWDFPLNREKVRYLNGFFLCFILWQMAMAIKSSQYKSLWGEIERIAA